ncbi:MAG TPA: ABC transporter permease [Candidatus Acidoferrales bacterium]|nr:ABC transporter permease [Candidatus Acidoferrales bacterium]
MTRITHRLVASLAILIGVTFLTFLLAFAIPSDPARTVAGPKADAETLANVRRELGLDRPLLEQYALYLDRLVHGDFGRSYLTRQSVLQAIVERLGATAYLATTSLVLAAFVGIALGCASAAQQGSTLERLMLGSTLLGLSLPAFWVGLMLLYVFAYRLRLLPLGGVGLINVILPATALAIGNAAYYARLVHTNVRDVLQLDYVRTARAKGVAPLVVYGRHALRNALLPVVTLLGLDLAGLMSGVVLTETIFNWPGIGRLAVEAVFNQDIPMVMGTVLFSALLIVAANIVVDALYAIIDPRLRLES